MMDWQQKFAAIKAFSGGFDTSLMMREPGDWYVSARMEIGGDGMLRSGYGNGSTPEEAVNDQWRICVEELPRDRYLVASLGNGEVRRGRWNGFMWELLTDDEAEHWRERHAPASAIEARQGGNGVAGAVEDESAVDAEGSETPSTTSGSNP